MLRRKASDRLRTVFFWLAVATAVASLFEGIAGAQSRRPRGRSGPEELHKPFAKPDTPRQTERIRTFDVKHIRAEIRLDTKGAEIRGTVTHTITPLHASLATVTLDCAAELKVSKVTAGLKGSPNSCKFERKNETLIIALDRPYGPDETLDVAVNYSGVSPKQGLYFIEPDAAAKPGTPMCVWTQGEADETHHWLPCYDFPNDRATSEMVVTVDKPLFVLSNGSLVETKENADNTITYHWKMDVPHVSYLIMLAASEFTVVHDKAGDLPVDYYVLKSFDEATARRAMGATPRMIDFFNKKIGHPYPYNKYAQVVVPEFTNGGMENITATTLNDYILSDETSYLENDSDGLVAHELAHQWFGDLMTCRHWPHLWLNEGFATYFDALYTEFDKGDDAFRLKMAGDFAGYAGGDRYARRAIVEPRYGNTLELFDGVSYSKGACVLHALRGYVGDDAWWKGIQGYVKTQKGNLVESDDLKKAMEKTSGKDLGWFFDQWVYKAGHPELKARWRYEAEDKTVRLTVEQIQKVDDLTPLFRLPTTVQIVEDGEPREVPIVIEAKSTEFAIPSPTKPKSVRIDVPGWIPKELAWEKPNDEWLHQLQHAKDALGRVEAARELAKSEDAKVMEGLLQAVKKEQVLEAKLELLRILEPLGDKGRSTFLEEANNPNPKVRTLALSALASGKLDAAAESLFRTALSKPDETYGARRAALRALNKGKVKDREELIAAALKSKSHNDTLAVLALELTLEKGGSQARETAVSYSGPGQPLALRRVAIQSLGRLARNDREVGKALLAMVGDPSRHVRSEVWRELVNAKVKGTAEALGEQRKKESGKLLTRLDDYLKELKVAKAPETEPSATSGEADDLDKKAEELEVQARDLRNQAEALRIERDKARLESSKTPK